MTSCNNCNSQTEQQLRYSFDREALYYGKTITKLSIVIVILIASLVVSVFLLYKNNEKWVKYLSEYDFESYEVTTSGGGNANFIGNDGDIYNGKSDSTPPEAEEPGQG